MDLTRERELQYIFVNGLVASVHNKRRVQAIRRGQEWEK